MVPLTSRLAELPDAEKRPRIVAWPAVLFLRCSFALGWCWSAKLGPTAQELRTSNPPARNNRPIHSSLLSWPTLPLPSLY